MSFSPLKDNAKSDTETEKQIERDEANDKEDEQALADEIGGTDKENDQVIHETYENAQGNRTVDVTIQNIQEDIQRLPINISINQIDELFPKLDKAPFIEQNYIAIMNYLQTYHFALKQLDAQYHSAQNTIQTYEEDIRMLNEFKGQVSDESSDYHKKMKDLEDKNKLLIDYANNLRGRFANYVAKSFSDGFDRMKEADAMTTILANEFNYQKPVDDHKHE